MLEEVAKHGELVWLGGSDLYVKPSPEEVKEIAVTPENYNPKVEDARPDGWVSERMRRVLVREQMDRSNGVDEDTINSTRNDKITEVGCGLYRIT
jgi:hypothetical protein